MMNLYHNTLVRVVRFVTSSLILFSIVLIAFPCSAQGVPSATEESWISPADPRIVYIGRFDDHEAARPRIAYPGVTVRIRFVGESVTARVTSDTDTSLVATIVDGAEPEIHRLPKGASELVLPAKSSEGPHVAEIVKRTETWQGVVTLLGIRLPAGGRLLEPLPLPTRKLMFIGDSVTCGAGIDHAPGCTDGKFLSSNAYESYGMLLGRRLDAQVHLVCFGGRGVIRDYRGRHDVLNGPQLLDLAVAADEPGQRVPWDHFRWTPDAIVVSLGTNDFNLQKDNPLNRDEFVSTYVRMIRAIRSRYPKANILLTEGAIVIDPALRDFVREAAQTAADPNVRWVEARHYPGLACDAHPTRLEHRRMADDLEPVLRQTLGW